MSVLERRIVRNWCRCAPLIVALCTIAHGAGTNFAVVFGGSGHDYAASVASDSAGNTYVSRLTYSPDLHVTPGAFQTLGGSGDDYATGVGVDAACNVPVTGYSGTVVSSVSVPVLNS